MEEKLKQSKGLHTYDFDKLSRIWGNPRERKRYLAFAHIRNGKNFYSAAVAVRISLRTLMSWIERFQSQGLDGLKDQPGRGAKPYLPPHERDAFRQAVLELQ